MKHLLTLACFLGWSVLASAQSSYSVTVRTASGEPIVNAVVSLVPAVPPATPFVPPSRPVIIAQIGQEYDPFVTPIMVGTRVDFPNHDKVQHHLYSVSPAKRFEKPLYKSGASESVLFDKPGVVTLGCNIHDWMSAYVVVLETPHFARTDAKGQAVIPALPAGDYSAEVWHPRQPKITTRPVTIAKGELTDSFTLDLRPVRGVRRAPTAEGSAY